VNLHTVKTRLPLWGGILLLPLLALGFYLDNQRQIPPVEARFTPPTSTTKLRDQLPRMESITPKGGGQLASETPAPVREITGLEPEAARQAVFHKENAVYEKATRLFDAEPIDVEWASGYEQSLREMFSSHQGLMRVSVNTISCHTRMCRIEVFTPRDTDADYFTAMFYNALDNFREGALKAEASIARRMEVGMTSVYIARQGHTLEFY
jgi:hypothetical protein